MDRDEAVAVLKAHEAELKRLGMEHLHLFGSVARGEAREDSDVDLFYDDPEGSIGLMSSSRSWTSPAAFSGARPT